ncbi:serine/threonine-protein kinase [Trypanosoma brucei equiperdum]|uniref:Serine/threonine-protein kinase n=1 Tax=Trypanosoma brucei equiperdum TaxID=630700 RepID=A0A3L6L6U9_9TRYP|nr:serine/threonine-protein kinase [Trypanosoma brucei equiperdum]
MSGSATTALAPHEYREQSEAGANLSDCVFQSAASVEVESASGAIVTHRLVDEESGMRADANSRCANGTEMPEVAHVSDESRVDAAEGVAPQVSMKLDQRADQNCTDAAERSGGAVLTQPSGGGCGTGKNANDPAMVSCVAAKGMLEVKMGKKTMGRADPVHSAGLSAIMRPRLMTVARRGQAVASSLSTESLAMRAASSTKDGHGERVATHVNATTSDVVGAASDIQSNSVPSAEPRLSGRHNDDESKQSSTGMHVANHNNHDHRRQDAFAPQVCSSGVVTTVSTAITNAVPVPANVTFTTWASSGRNPRPIVALSVHLSELYRRIDALCCQKRRMAEPGPKYNDGFDDKEGHYLVLYGEEILNRYTVRELLGKGSFGTVVRCFDAKRQENVALKITRHGLSFRTQAKLELDILLGLNGNPRLNSLVVKLLKAFDWRGHLVLVFELLTYNLYQLIKHTGYRGVGPRVVRKFAFQLVQALRELEEAKPSPIIHCDIKPENILLKYPNRSSIRLIDFGSATYTNKVIHRYIQSRYYRSPEVILYLEYGTAIDRWSLGCVLVELYTGLPLFDGKTEAAQLARFEALLGPVPVDMLESSPKLNGFYEKVGRNYKLKEPLPPHRSLKAVLGLMDGATPQEARRIPLEDEVEDALQLYDFVSRLLRYRASERMSCEEALRHPFLEPMKQ